VYQDSVKLGDTGGGYVSQAGLHKWDIIFAVGQTLVQFDVQSSPPVGGLIVSCQSKTTPALFCSQQAQLGKFV
jgi:hypothetical protein